LISENFLNLTGYSRLQLHFSSFTPISFVLIITSLCRLNPFCLPFRDAPPAKIHSFNLLINGSEYLHQSRDELPLLQLFSSPHSARNFSAEINQEMEWTEHFRQSTISRFLWSSSRIVRQTATLLPPVLCVKVSAFYRNRFSVEDGEGRTEEFNGLFT
jgi:hypothetical protein